MSSRFGEPVKGGMTIPQAKRLLARLAAEDRCAEECQDLIVLFTRYETGEQLTNGEKLEAMDLAQLIRDEICGERPMYGQELHHRIKVECGGKEGLGL